MTELESQNIINGIAAYKHQQKVFLRLLRKRGCFTEHEFDKWFKPWNGKRRRWFLFIGDDSIILGGLIGGLRNKSLHLLQIMSELGMIVASEENGIIVYRLGTSYES